MKTKRRKSTISLRDRLEATDFTFRTAANKPGKASFLLTRDGCLLGSIDGDRSLMTKLAGYLDYYFTQYFEEPVNDDDEPEQMDEPELNEETDEDDSEEDDGGGGAAA